MSTDMDMDMAGRVGWHVAALRREGELLAAAAERTDLGAPVPTCPDWALRDLVRHVGGVHRWAHAHVASLRADHVPGEDEPALMETWPADPDDTAALQAWFGEGHRALVDALASADPAADCWHFLHAPSGVAFWARRQAHETAIHRADAESAAGAIAPYDPGFAADGIDEMLCGFLARRSGRLRSDRLRTLALRADDAGRSWYVRIGPSPVQTTDGTAGDGPDADCTVRGSASDLYLWVWNRLGRDAGGTLDVHGDRALLELWRQKARVTWS